MKYLSENIELMKEWNYEANGELDPNKLTLGSNKKASWICSYCGHKWETSIYHRCIKNTGCPHCYVSRRSKIPLEKSIIKTHSEIAKDWDYQKNGKLTPDFFTKGSRYHAFWKCHSCGKEIQSPIKNYNGCASCKKNSRLLTNNLELLAPDLAKEWHPIKNGDLKPNQVSFGSDKRAWWKCLKCSYEWESKICNRSILHRGCPACAHTVVFQGFNDLATINPELAKEWDYAKNGDLKPNMVLPSCNKKVWWKCSEGHSYQATINHRNSRNGTSCPICASGRQTSFAEQAFYFYIHQLYPDAVNRYKSDFLGQMELDIYIPSIKYAIEYDGMAFHKKDKLSREEKKYQLCKQNGIKLIRFREESPVLGLEIADDIYHTSDLYIPKNLEQMIILFLKKIDFSGKSHYQYNFFDVNIQRDRIKILNLFKQSLKNKSFGELYPELAKEWHPIKNGNLTPFMFKPMSNQKIWWICPKCSHEYQATIAHRVNAKNPKRATNCPKCGIESSKRSKSLEVLMINPENNQVIKIFDSISDAARKTKVNSSNISMVCKGQRPKAGGYIWKYKI